MFEVRLNVKAERELADLREVDPVTAEQVDLVLDALELRPDVMEDEPWPYDQGAAFLSHVGDSDWYVAWIYSRDRDVVLVGKIFSMSS